MEEHNKALKAIQKKLIGKKLSYKEIYSIMDQIAKDKLGDVLTTYFVASGYAEGFTKEELYFLTKAMIETGEKLEFKGVIDLSSLEIGEPLYVPFMEAAQDLTPYIN